MRVWTPEARAAQSALIKKLKPWTKSTGPKTEAGKLKASRNSFKTGLHSKTVKKVRAYFRDCRTFLKFLKTNCYEKIATERSFPRRIVHTLHDPPPTELNFSNLH